MLSKLGDALSTATRDDAKRGVSGDYCQIWDIEQHELEELAFFKRVDAMLFRAGKPHMADILQLDRLALPGALALLQVRPAHQQIDAASLLPPCAMSPRASGRRAAAGTM